ncbi:hypothetical protein [Falsiroseomonas sp. E2-1-a20]|uniref:hypothetical protein n=1 Tax=Falsiroseomonas sp. E2-1-a20 TaxID=3239300 RepID=UPI003F3E5DB3
MGTIGLIVLLSILLHGLTVTPVMRLLDLAQGRDPDAPERSEILPPGLTGPARMIGTGAGDDGGRYVAAAQTPAPGGRPAPLG